MTTVLSFDYGLVEMDDWASAPHELLVLNTGWTPDPTNHFIADLSAFEISAGGYSRIVGTGSGDLGETVTVDTSLHIVTFDLADSDFGSWTGEALQYAVAAKKVTNDSDSILLWAVAFAPTDPGGSDFTAEWPAAGVVVRAGVAG